jgi:hypothetical protein
VGSQTRRAAVEWTGRGVPNGPRMTGQPSDLTLYQRLPTRLIFALVVGPLALIYYVWVAQSFGPIPGFRPLLALMFAATIFLTIYGVASTFKMFRRPALVLDRAGLTLHGFSIPWARISAIKPFRTRDGAGLGLVIDRAVLSESTQGPGAPRLTRKLLKARTNSYGVLPVPPMRGISSSDLQASMEAYRGSVLG